MPMDLIITKEGNTYNVNGTYYVSKDEFSNEGPFSLNRKFTSLPISIPTRAGIITISSNNGRILHDGQVLKVNILSPKMASTSMLVNYKLHNYQKQHQ